MSQWGANREQASRATLDATTCCLCSRLWLLQRLRLLQLLLLQLPGCFSVVPPADSLTASSRSSMRLFLNT